MRIVRRFAAVSRLFAGGHPGRLVTMNDDPTGTNPYSRMTLTLGGIARANLVVVTVTGAAKAETLAAVANGDDLPAARIEAEQVVWLVDQAAASLLPS